MERVLVTGANGFIGKRLCQVLHENGYTVRAALRHECTCDGLRAGEEVFVGEIGRSTQWNDALKNVDYVIHLAARVHVMKESLSDPLTKFREVNTAGTLQLAEQAIDQGVKRFLYVSTIKVNGEATDQVPFFSDDTPNPQDAYAISKAEAENELKNISFNSEMEVVCIRPPLIYGPGVKGNLLRLMKLIKTGLPLPLASIQNQRSMVSLNNLVDLLMCCLKHPHAAGETFLVADKEKISTPELIDRLANQMGTPVRLFPMPLWLLRIVGVITRQQKTVNRLCESMELDLNKNKNLLGWEAPELVNVGIKKMVDWYMSKHSD